MIDFFDKLDGKGIFTEVNGEKVYVTEEEKEKILQGCDIVDGKVVETEEYLEKAKQEKRNEAYKKFKQTLSVITDKYTQDERESFDLKVKEAEKFLKTGSSPFLEALVIEGETVEELAQKIMENNTGYRLLYATAEKTLREELKLI